MHYPFEKLTTILTTVLSHHRAYRSYTAFSIADVQRLIGYG